MRNNDRRRTLNRSQSLTHDAPTMKPFLFRWGPAILSGILLALSFPGPGVHFLAWVALAPLLWRTADLPPRAAFARFFLASWVFHSILLYWLLTHFYWAGGVALLGHQLLSAYLALYHGAAGAVWVWARRRLPRTLAPVALAALWAVAEYLHATVFGGFGWSALGYSQGPNPAVLQWAALGGVTLVSFLVVLTNGLVAEAVRPSRGRWAFAAGALAAVAGAHGLGATMLDDAEYGDAPLRVGLFQSNFAQEIKWDPAFTLTMLGMAAEQSRALAEEGQTDLLVWPETLITAPPTREEVYTVLRTLAEGTGNALYAGATRSDPEGRGEFNASVFVDERGAIVDYYDKMHLAPFGEYIPFGDLLPGQTAKVFPVRDRTFGPLICFEVLFPAMAADLRERGADFLVVITNLGWFGMSSAIPQELEIARFRAVENRLPLVHSANTGISGVFDPWGRFEPVRGFFDAYGQYREYPREHAAEIMRMRRGVGAFRLPAPAESPLPSGPRYFPWLAGVLAAAFVAAAALRKGRSEENASDAP